MKNMMNIWKCLMAEQMANEIQGKTNENVICRASKELNEDRERKKK